MRTKATPDLRKDDQADGGNIGSDRRTLVHACESMRIAGDGSRHSQQLQEVHGKKSEIGANEDQPEMELARSFRIRVTGDFEKAIVPVGADLEHGAE